MEFAIQVWSPYLKRDIECLERVQRRATKLVKEFRKLSYEDRLCKLKLTSLVDRRLRGDLIETYKIITAKRRYGRKISSFSATHVTTCEDIVISWLQHAVVWRSVATFSVNVWWVLGTACQPTSLQRLLSMPSRTVTTR